jgi:hypothetical protein
VREFCIGVANIVPVIAPIEFEKLPSFHMFSILVNVILQLLLWSSRSRLRSTYIQPGLSVSAIVLEFEKSPSFWNSLEFVKSPQFHIYSASFEHFCNCYFWHGLSFSIIAFLEFEKSPSFHIYSAWFEHFCNCSEV